MFRKFLYLLIVLAVLSNGMPYNAFAQKKAGKTVSKKKNTKSKVVKSKLKGKTSKRKKGTKKSKSRYKVITDTVQLKLAHENKLASLQMIADNKEKTRITDSLHKTTLISTSQEDKEGYYATGFSSQLKGASLQTIEGTAATFKSVSGWSDKKFYVLTNQMPIGTIVRITTPDAKSICAKVINILPDEGSEIQYRISDSAAANLGISNKTFKVSITY